MYKIVFAGTPDFAVPSLQACLESSHEVCAVYTQKDRPKGRGQILTPSPIKKLAESADIPVHTPLNFKDPDVIATLAAYKPDLIIVVAYGMILPQAVLDIPVLTCLNVHASLLPRWRGAAPVQAAIIAGDSETGVSIQRMVLGLDEGDVMLEKRTGIEPEETAKDLMERLAELGGEALVQALDQLDLGTAKFIPQDPNSVTMTRKIRKQDGRLDWSLDPSALRRHVRAMNSWPGASTHLPGGKALTVLALKESSSTNEPPGTFLGGPGFRVACGKGSATGSNSVDLLQVKPAGKSAMDGAAFLRGSRLTPGDLLGAETTS